jgi:hypothetical protein
MIPGVPMTLLVPGRHHLVTAFQASYLFRFCNSGMDGEIDMDGRPLEGCIDRVVFAVTSADHSLTRRNPLPFFARAMALHELGANLRIDLLVYGIPEAGNRDDFADYAIKTIFHESEGTISLTPSDCVVACATGVAELYRKAGFRVWGAERSQPSQRSLPWEILEKVAANPRWRKDRDIASEMHPVSYRMLIRYGFDRMLARVMSDPLLGADGDITATRDYGSYVRQMDQNIEQKWGDTEAFVKPGRVGDIGCAVGSWIAKASHDPRFVNSDFYGIEITMALHDICVQRRHNGEFGTPNVWFAQRNAVEGTVFKPGSMTTIHTSSLTHEIESYAGRDALMRFIGNRLLELEPGGVWVNRDVVGPEHPETRTFLELSTADGVTPGAEALLRERERLRGTGAELGSWLASLSTYSRFLVFARDFRKAEGYALEWEAARSRREADGAPVSESAHAADDSEGPSTTRLVRLTLGDAMEFLSKKDYTDNWESEMHETFCFWSFSRWRECLEIAGFSVSAKSRAVTNEWIVNNRWLGRARLLDDSEKPLPWPPTNAILIAEKKI